MDHQGREEDLRGAPTCQHHGPQEVHQEAGQHPGEHETPPEARSEGPADKVDGQQRQTHEEGAIRVDGEILRGGAGEEVVRGGI